MKYSYEITARVPSLLHGRFLCRQATLFPLRNDPKNGCVADYKILINKNAKGRRRKKPSGLKLQ